MTATTDRAKAIICDIQAGQGGSLDGLAASRRAKRAVKRLAADLDAANAKLANLVCSNCERSTCDGTNCIGNHDRV